MNNHDVPRSPSRYGLPQVKGAPYHQLPHDWLLRNGTTYPEDRELGTRRARAAALMELGLPGAAYIYQGEELGLFEVADIPWDRLEDPTAFHTARPRWIRAVTVAACLCLDRFRRARSGRFQPSGSGRRWHRREPRAAVRRRPVRHGHFLGFSPCRLAPMA